ncbi:piggyBac transposable element-derived protein 4-like [Strongylocentrotus purpuratus]|uniref:PiggyBac transposable element-derived protein domain-containing protein n=1 Tax=Strongylocentrotus purpuratus TaxID=7668 RepID=A0A7M7GHK3_STRPU|nr:piggyBac transposable element-derived protein 4-like [Strongylocentrotus purpuratus]|eukprot:XP_003723976.1 PREDICTED: piggyBac transposable element-derived protein 4-like [Strongylocentrotus purpuratus]
MASSSEYDSSDSETDNIPLKLVRKLHRRNEKIADKLNAGGYLDFDEIDDEEDSDHGDDRESSESDTYSDFATHIDGDDSDHVASVSASTSRSTARICTAIPNPVPIQISPPQSPAQPDDEDSDEAMPSAPESSDEEAEQQLIAERGRKKARGRPPGRRRVRDRSRTPPRQWTDNVTDSAGKRFTGPQPGPTGNFATLSEAETFQLLFTDEFLNEIVLLTNKNFERKKLKSPTKHKMKWYPVTRAELETWFGVIIGMGLLQLKGDIRKYWSVKHKLTRTDGFPEVFPRDRFLQVLRYIHFVDEEIAITNRQLAGFDKFYKIRYIFNYLVPKFQEVYNPERDVAIDESMIKGQARMPARQFMKNKPTRWGLKVFALAESQSAYVLNLDLYEGKTQGERQNTFNVVTNLSQNYRGFGHVIFMDNFYTSVPLFNALYTSGFMAVGTLRENRKYLPSETVGKKKQQVKQLARGETLWRQSDKLYCVTWKDTKPVYILSTVPLKKETQPVHRMAKRNGQWTRIEIERPDIVGLYNKHMGGVDLADKKIACYKRQTKSLKWYHKVIWYMLDIAVLNACILYNKSHNTKVKLRDFRERLSTSLIAGRTYRKTPSPPPHDNVVRFNRTLNHAPKKMETASTCKIHLQRVDTIYTCSVCEVRMCPDPCFSRYHYMDKFAYNDPERQHKKKARKKLKLVCN